MDNTKVLHALDEFAKTKPKDIPKELDDYIRNVAGTGDHVYQWSLVKCLFRQKLVNVISEFYESCPMMDVPLSPNVDAFNYELLKSRLLQRYDKFTGAPFTIQRLAELLTAPRKQYNRVDKFMRAIEKNIWVVSTREPGRRESVTQETSLVNGVLSPLILSNNVKTTQERLIRQAELFDDDDDDEEENDDEPGEPTVSEVPLAEPEIEAEATCESSSSSSTPAEGSPEETESTATLEPELQNPEKPDSVEAEAATVITETNSEEIEDPIVNENSLTSVSSNDEQEQEELKADVEDIPEEEEKESPKENDSSQVTVAEVSEPESEESVAEEQETTSVVQAEPEPDVKVDLKRKFVSDDEEEEVLSKKLETEELAPVVEEAPSEGSVPEEIVQEEAAPVEQKAEVVTGILDVTDTEQEVETGGVESAAELERIDVVEEECSREQERESTEMGENGAEAAPVEIAEVEEMAEKEMDSADIEEKVEMVVEEPEQAMEVDEANSQSPMEDCTAGEPMEADMGQS